jgi:predicted Zn-dependent protease
LAFPQDLISDYSPAVIPISLGWGLVNIVGAVMVLSTLVFALFAWRRGLLGPERLSARAAGWGIVWFVITLSPTANIVFLSGILLSERTLYLPSVGFVAAAAWLILRFYQERPRVAVGAVILALSLMGSRSWTRTPTWKNNLEVFNTLIVEHPESGRSQWVLGDTYIQTGQWSEGLRSYRLAVGIIGGHYTLLVEIGKMLMGAGYDRPAELILRSAWDDRPEMGMAPGLLAPLYDRNGRFVEAEEAARATLAVDSTLAVQHHVLSRALAAQGRFAEASQARLAAIRNGEGDHWEQWGWLAELGVALGDTAGAWAALDSARLRGSSPSVSRQIDSFFVGLGLLSSENIPPESARNSQNPRSGGGIP